MIEVSLMKSEGLRLALVCVTLPVVLIGCGSADPTGSSPKSSNHTAAPLPSVIPGQLPIKTGWTAKGAPALGVCIALRGDPEAVKSTVLPCDDSSATFKVVDVAEMPNACPQDVDNKYFYQTPDGRDYWTACLDFNWRAGECIDTSGMAATVACKDAVNRERVYRPLSIHIGTSDKSVCNGAPSNIHPARKYVVCLERP
jgi:hypothetical protein